MEKLIACENLKDDAASDRVRVIKAKAGWASYVASELPECYLFKCEAPLNSLNLISLNMFISAFSYFWTIINQ